MKTSEVIEKLRAYLKCQRLQVKGIYEDCNNKLCDNCDLCYAQGTVGEHIKSIEIAIQALRDIQQYREVGTVDECREANGKQMPKKVKEDGYFGFVDYVCPTCGHDAGSSGTKYCKNCGQKLRWL